MELFAHVAAAHLGGLLQGAPACAELVLAALVPSFVLALALGSLAARHHNRLPDQVVRAAAFAGWAFPHLLCGLVWGTRVAFKVGLSITVGRALIGVLLGLVSGYSSGLLDAVIMRITDVFLAFPICLSTQPCASISTLHL